MTHALSSKEIGRQWRAMRDNYLPKSRADVRAVVEARSTYHGPIKKPDGFAPDLEHAIAINRLHVKHRIKDPERHAKIRLTNDSVKAIRAGAPRPTPVVDEPQLADWQRQNRVYVAQPKSGTGPKNEMQRTADTATRKYLLTFARDASDRLLASVIFNHYSSIVRLFGSVQAYKGASI